MRIFFNKRKINRWCVKNITPDLIKSVILLVLSIIILSFRLKETCFSIDNMVDTNIIVSFFIVAVCGTISTILLKVVINITEDAMKISDNYANLVTKYCLKHIVHQ